MALALRRGAVAAGLAALAAVLAITPLANNDIWLHLRTGSLILEQGGVPRAEVYTFTRAGAPIVDHEWLAQIVLALVHRAGGVPALSLLAWLLTVATLAVVFAEAYRLAREAAGGAGAGGEEAAFAAASVASAGAALLIASHLDVRPHLATFLLAALYGRLLPRALSGERGASRRAVTALLVLQVLWTNLHGGFVIGILLAGLAAAERSAAARRIGREAALPVLLAAASLANPYGWRIYALVGTFLEPAFREFIVEWQSPFHAPFTGSPLFAVWLAGLAAAGLSAAAAIRRGLPAPILAPLAVALMSLSSRRHVSLFGVVSAPLVAAALAPWLAKLGRRVAAATWGAAAGIALLAAAIGAAGMPVGEGTSRRPGVGIAANMPVEALAAMRAEGVRGRVFASFAFAAYVTWAGWPEMTTFIDSRLEVAGGEALRRYVALREPSAFREQMERTPFDAALLSWQADPVAAATQVLGSDPGWALVYFDDAALLYLRRGPGTEDLIARRAFRLLQPFRFLAGGGHAGGTDLGALEAEARRAVSDPPVVPGRPPVNAFARILLAAALQPQGRDAEAAAELKKALAQRPDAALAWGMLGLSLQRTGDLAGARAAFEELRRRAPGSAFAAEMLRRLGAAP